ncbi:MAG: TIGR03790 family protein [Luteolibacter sp.]
MRKFVCLALAWLAGCHGLMAELTPADVAVLFNSSDPESVKLAGFYQVKRGVPEGNMIGLPMPAAQDISREQYDSAIRDPLRAEFKERGWVQLARDPKGIVLPVRNKIRVVLTMRGVPLRIQAAETKTPADPKNPVANDNKASVDSELAMFAVDGLPTDGVLKNAYFQNTASITDAKLPFEVLTARIDAPSVATCERMINDAIETEKTGLWGRAYIDIANKVPLGDQWLENVAKENLAVGIPTVIDRFNDTLPKNYPATDMAVYFGWYDWHVSGPFLNPRFQFKKGAIAAHLHSFSGEQLRNPSKNWCAPLLERGAAATLGNVYEPYLHLTHQFDAVQRGLLAGHTWVEAAWMGMPVCSWQGIVLGDPLYRPFSHLDGSGEKRDADIPYRALRAALLQWPGDGAKRRAELQKAVERMKSGTLAEALGLEWLALGQTPLAAGCFRQAKSLYVATEDQMRQDFHLIALDRAQGKKVEAVKALREAATRYGPLPEATALHGWLDILDPPPPPIADPTKAPAIQKP